MAKIICHNAVIYSMRENCKDVTVLMCKDDCTICRGVGYTLQEPPKAEIINPSAREMIEAEVTEAEKGGWRELNYLDGLRYALECLDKPADDVSEEDHKKIHERYTQSIATDAKYYTEEEFKALTGFKF